jgi:hypothetical protein
LDVHSDEDENANSILQAVDLRFHLPGLRMRHLQACDAKTGEIREMAQADSPLKKNTPHDDWRLYMNRRKP